MSWNWLSSLGIPVDGNVLGSSPPVLEKAPTDLPRPATSSSLLVAAAPITSDSIFTKPSAGSDAGSRAKLFDVKSLASKARSSDVQSWVTQTFEELFFKIEASLMAIQSECDEKVSRAEARTIAVEKQLRVLFHKVEDANVSISEEAIKLKTFRREFEKLEDSNEQLRTAFFSMRTAQGQTENTTFNTTAKQENATVDVLNNLIADVEVRMSQNLISKCISCIKAVDLTRAERLASIESLQKEKATTPTLFSESGNAFPQDNIGKDAITTLAGKVTELEQRLTQQIVSQSLFCLRSAEMTPTQRYECLETLEKKELLARQQQTGMQVPGVVKLDFSQLPTTKRI